MNDLLRFFRSIEKSLSATTRDDIRQIVQALRTKLETISVIMPSENFGGKMAFVFRRRRMIEAACEELEAWEQRFFRRAVTMLFFGDLSTSGVEPISYKQNSAMARMKRIHDAIMPDQTHLAKLCLEDFPGGTKFVQLADSDMYVVEGSPELVEFRWYNDAPAKEVEALKIVVREFAARMREADPSSMGLLSCIGFSPDHLKHRLTLRFSFPADQTAPHTLQQLLAEEAKHSLTARLGLARKLASAVLYLHGCNLVHKNIRSSNILVFQPLSADGAKVPRYRKGDPYLVGFDDVRKADAKSKMLRVEDWKRNIYLHPDGHRMEAGDEYTMGHDSNSLGVVLLEIALWTSAANSGGDLGRHLWHQAEGRLLAPDDLKSRYIEIARSAIPRRLSDKYRDVVVSCLERLKNEEADGLLQDQDGIVVGSAYVTQIMNRLEEISL